MKYDGLNGRSDMIPRHSEIHYTPRNCKLCGKEFNPTSSSQKYCVECGKYRKHGKQRPIYVPNPNANKELEEIMRKASAEHLTYGQYVMRHGL